MPSPETNSATANCFRVIVVDDNEADRKLLAIHLGRSWPFERDLVVEQAGDGAEALAKLRRERYALVVLDWRLPTISGGELLRVLRQNGVRIPVVIVSGLQRQDIPEDLEALGATFLNKDEMNIVTFHDAIATSLRLLGLAT